MKKTNLTIGLIAVFFVAISANLQAQDKTEKVYTDEDYDKAIAKGVEYILSQQKDDGSWEEISRLEKMFWRTGPTALACYAILEAYPNLLNEKDNPMYPKIEKALRWMMKDLEQNAKGEPIKGDKQDKTTYSLGLRANTWLAAITQLRKSAKTAGDKKKVSTPDVKKLSEEELSAELFTKCLELDVIRLFAAGVDNGGGYEYETDFVTPAALQAKLKNIKKVKGNTNVKCDNSNSQYGLYGVWAGKRCGGQFEEIIPKEFYRICMEFWMKRQWKNGMWDYREAEHQDDDSQERSMTTAGIASMYVCFDEVFSQSFKGCTPPPEAAAAMKSIQNGLKWISDNYEQNLNVGWQGLYYFYGVERVGLASGYKFFGKHDWYKSISYTLLKGQTDSGSWN